MTWNDFPLLTGRISSAMSLCLHPPPACDISHPAPASGRRVLVRAHRAARRLAESPRRDRQSLRRLNTRKHEATCREVPGGRRAPTREAGAGAEAAPCGGAASVGTQACCRVQAAFTRALLGTLCCRTPPLPETGATQVSETFEQGIHFCVG